ncbi:hypothetical protein WJX73_010299 [Symbiochloris irregularis]|uniref:Bromo domain-containing protein n=1 Tax=Symbiochloris irregularis TaxID=706552 RepID=A0AAW1NWY8_9CHLO
MQAFLEVHAQSIPFTLLSGNISHPGRHISHHRLTWPHHPTIQGTLHTYCHIIIHLIILQGHHLLLHRTWHRCQVAHIRVSIQKFFSPRGTGVVLKNPGILPNLKKRPAKPKATSSGISATPPTAFTPPTADAEAPTEDLKPPVGQGLPKSSASAIAAAASAVELREPADKGKRMASEDGEASPRQHARKSPRRDSRSPSLTARDRPPQHRESSQHESSRRDKSRHESSRQRRDSHREDRHAGTPEHRHRRSSHHKPHLDPPEAEGRHAYLDRPGSRPRDPSQPGSPPPRSANPASPSLAQDGAQPEQYGGRRTPPAAPMHPGMDMLSPSPSPRSAPGSPVTSPQDQKVSEAEAKRRRQEAWAQRNKPSGQEAEQQQRQRQRLAEEMEDVRKYIEDMFLAQLPRCHAVIPHFPVTGREATLSWQKRLEARAAQYHWHAPSERLDGSQPDFSQWDGNPNDPVNFPIAHSFKPAQEAEAAAASLESALQDTSKAPAAVQYDADFWMLVEEDPDGEATPFLWDIFSPTSEDAPTDPRAPVQSSPSPPPILLPVPKFAWRPPAVKSPEAEEEGQEVSRSWADSPIAEPGPEAISGPAREDGRTSLKPKPTQRSLGEAPPSELADGTSPTELPDSALRTWFDSAYQEAVQAGAAEPQSPEAATGDGISPPMHSPTGADAARQAFWQAGAQPAPADEGPLASAPAQAQIPSAAAEPAAQQPHAERRHEGQQGADEPRRQRKRRRSQSTPTAQQQMDTRKHICLQLTLHWKNTHFKKVAAALIETAIGECYGPWRRERDEEEKKEEERRAKRQREELQQKQEDEQRELDRQARDQKCKQERKAEEDALRQRKQHEADEAEKVAKREQAEADKRKEEYKAMQKAAWHAAEAKRQKLKAQPSAVPSTSAPPGLPSPAAAAATAAALAPPADAHATQQQQQPPQQQLPPAPPQISSLPTHSPVGDDGTEAATPVAPPAASPQPLKRPGSGRGAQQRAAAPERILDEPDDDGSDEEYAPLGSRKSGLARGNSSAGRAPLKRSGSSISRSTSAKKARGGASGSSVSASGQGRGSGASRGGGADADAGEQHQALAAHAARQLLSMVEDLKKFDLKNAHIDHGLFTPEIDGEILGNPRHDGERRKYSEVVQRPMSLTLIGKGVAAGTKKSAKKGPAVEPYEASLEGVERFKADLDLLASNCRQFWGPEVEFLSSHPELQAESIPLEDMQEFLAHAAEFQTLVDEKYAAGVSQVKHHANAASRPL